MEKNKKFNWAQFALEVLKLVASFLAGAQVNNML